METGSFSLHMTSDALLKGGNPAIGLINLTSH